MSNAVVSAAGCDFELQNLVLRRIYPFILGVVLFVAFCIFQAQQFRRLYEHIKNDKSVCLSLVCLMSASSIHVAVCVGLNDMFQKCTFFHCSFYKC